MKWFIFISFIIAYILMVMPLSSVLMWYRPEFIALLVVYWSMHEPHHFGLRAAWFAGFFQDLIEMNSLGVYAVSMLFVAYGVHLIYQRLRSYVLWHQSLWILVLLGAFQLISNWLSSIFDNTSVSSPLFLLSSLIACLLWPLLSMLLGRLRVFFHLAN